MKIMVLDTETTAKKDGSIHELCGIVWHAEKDFVSTVHIRMAPSDDAIIEDKALEIGHTTREELKTFPSQEEGFFSFIKFCSGQVEKFDKTDRMFFCAYNAPFDAEQFIGWQNHMQLVRGLYGKFGKNEDIKKAIHFGSYFFNNCIDLMSLAGAHLMNRRTSMENFQLKTTLATIGIKYDESKLHSGKYDTFLEYELTRYLLGLEKKAFNPEFSFDNFKLKNI